MAVYMNSLGEFVIPDPPDKDLNREKAYRSCINVDMERMRRNAVREEGRLASEREAETAECQNCHRKFPKRYPYQKYCSPKCQRDKYNEARRKEHAARKAASPKKAEAAECLFCRAVFEKKRPTQKYCTEACQRADHNRKRRNARGSE